MTNQAILTKAIEKAIAGGWNNEDMLSADSHIDGWLFDPGIGEYGGHKEPQSLIFDHDFAKALWGEEKEEISQLDQDNHVVNWPNHWMYKWEMRLMEMVIADDPIKYLGENI